VSIDWAQVHERLERGRRALSGPLQTPEEERALLERRARELALPLTDGSEAQPALDVVVFTLAGVRYGADAHSVVEAIELDQPTRVPCTPPVLLGIVNHRGRVLPVFDLARLLATEPGAGHAWVVAVEVDGMAFGLGAETVEETLRLRLDELAPAPAGPVRGVTDDLLTVLDLEALAVDPRLHIDDSEL
jgi:purine-binding chemotaxis protein CheW